MHMKMFGCTVLCLREEECPTRNNKGRHMTSVHVVWLAKHSPSHQDDRLVADCIVPGHCHYVLVNLVYIHLQYTTHKLYNLLAF